MARPANLILEDAAVRITIGGPADGAAPDFTGATAFSVMGVLRRASIESTVQKTNTKGAGDRAVRSRYHSNESTLEIESFVPSLGYTFAGAPANGTFEGHYIKIETKEISSLATYREFIGVIERWRWEGRVAGEQVENISVGLNPDYDMD